MAGATRLSLQLLEALREEEPRAVEELLHLGADPNLVLDGGVAAVHLAARAGHPRALHCLRMLLRRGADPNARSSEALTPMHVAAAWGCREALELLLSWGGDPTLRDQDGLRPLAWALQQGHHNCAHLLRELDTSTRTGKETPGPTGDRDLRASYPHSLVSPMSDLQLLQALRALGQSPGPVTPFTRGHYLRRLQEAQASPAVAGHSPELSKALKTGHIPDCQADEAALSQHFEQPAPSRRWQGGITKSSFTYLLLDPRLTQGLPARASSLTLVESLQCFVRAIFYVGKGTRARPDTHLWEALAYRDQPGKQACPKVRRILDIWDSGRGVISLHCFQHVVAVEAFTREACLLDALGRDLACTAVVGIQTLTNQKQGHYYGVVAHWSPPRRRRLGVYLLQRALLIFLAEGERELRPQDIQVRG